MDRTIKLTTAQVSALETSGLVENFPEWLEEYAEGMALLRDNWSGNKLVVPEGKSAEMKNALIDIANSYDAQAEEADDPWLSRNLMGACGAMCDLATKVSKVGK